MKIKDRLFLSSFAGGISAIFANTFLYILNIFLPGNNINMPELTAEIFLNITPAEISPVTRLLGFIWSMVVGGAYALVYIIALDITGWYRLSVKAVLIIVGGWLLAAGLITRLLSLGLYVRDEPLSILAFFTAHIFFAIVLSLFVKHYGTRDK